MVGLLTGSAAADLIGVTMTDEPTEDYTGVDLTDRLLGALTVFSEYLDVEDDHDYVGPADSQSASESEMVRAVRDTVELVPILLEDYSKAWDMFEIAREAVQTQVSAAEANVRHALRTPGEKLILPY